MKEPLNLVIAGVGGQGNILVSEIVATAANEAGYHVTVGESYGLSQRGGAVSSHVRLSREMPYGPVILAGRADVILGFEPVEAARVLLEYGHPGVRVIVNPRPVYPVGVLLGKSNYPQVAELLAVMKSMAAEVRVIESTLLAMEAGNPVVQNVVLVGALAGSGYLPIEPGVLAGVVERAVPPSALAVNMKAFNLGLKAVKLNTGDKSNG